MVTNNKKKRLLSLALVGLMLTPMMSFATTDNTSTTTGQGTKTNTTTNSTADTTGTANDTIAGAEEEQTWIDKLKSNAKQAATVAEETILAEREFMKLSSVERMAEAAKNGIVAANNKADIEGHSYVCSNGGYELYLNKDRLSILIRDEKSGAVMRSTLTPEQAVSRGYNQIMYDTVTTGVAIKPIVYDEASENARFGAYSDGQLEGINPNSVTYTDIKEGVNVIGFKAHVTFPDFGFEFDLNVTLNSEGILSVEVPKSSLVESNPSYMMASAQFFPLLGWTDRGDRDGYMILPDGNGITVDYVDCFQNGEPKYKTQYSKMVYGNDCGINERLGNSTAVIGTSIESSRDFTNDAEDVTVPYFGNVYSDTQMAMVGLIEKGEYGAYIEGNINGMNNCFENYVSPRFVYRTLYVEYTDSVGSSERRKTSKDTMIDDIKVSYMFTGGEEANYSGLASKLRTYMLETGIIEKREDTEFDVRLDFLGVDKENFLIFRRNVVATTAEDIADIINKLADKGVTNLIALFEGWQKDGVYSLPNYEFEADSDVGGNSGITDLYKELQSKGIDFYPSQDMITINTSLNSSVFTSINSYTGRTYERNEMFNQVFNTFRLLYPEKTKEYVKELAADFVDSGIKNVALSGLSDNLFVYAKNDEAFTRQDSMKYYTEALKDVKDKGMKLVLESPFMYQWKYADAYLDLTLGSSMYVYASSEIPFLSSLLKGSMNVYSEYINFEANSTEYYLKLVETGVLPSFLITKESPSVLQYTNSNWNYSSEYDKYEDTIAEYYKTLKSINDRVEGEYIVKHEKLDGDVTVTTYSNGVKVYVNFSDVDHTVEDENGISFTVKAENYEVR